MKAPSSVLVGLKILPARQRDKTLLINCFLDAPSRKSSHEAAFAPQKRHFHMSKDFPRSDQGETASSLPMPAFRAVKFLLAEREDCQSSAKCEKLLLVRFHFCIQVEWDFPHRDRKIQSSTKFFLASQEFPNFSLFACVTKLSGAFLSHSAVSSFKQKLLFIEICRYLDVFFFFFSPFELFFVYQQVRA